MVRVHPTALIEPTVSLGTGCEVGPFCRFEGRVEVGPNCRFGTGVCLGSRPMDRKFQAEETAVRIGSGNIFHDYSTVSRSVGEGTATVIGDNNYIMAYVHIAHNCRIGSGCILTNGVQLAGHVEVFDQANLGGLVGVHQFCRIGRLAMVGAGSYVNKDIPPFMLAAGNPCRVRGLNLVGLRRAGISDSALSLLKQAFRIIYRSNYNLAQALKLIENELSGKTAGIELAELLEFCHSSKRGIELRTGPELLV
ncbi:MAG: acyl-ACP--UDP-N-acetylglucosamine O-acyltransferase [candidate division WOR-3 bacterium]